MLSRIDLVEELEKEFEYYDIVCETTESIEWFAIANFIQDKVEEECQQARKETAEKIFEMLKKKGTIHTEFDWNDYLEIDIDDLKELAKQFGVEIKE